MKTKENDLSYRIAKEAIKIVDSIIKKENKKISSEIEKLIKKTTL